MPKFVAPLVLLLILIATPQAHAENIEITLSSIQDNTLYEDPAGSLSNGAGDRMFTGVTLQPALRRALLAFDLSTIPVGSEILDATLTLEQVMTISGAQDVSLHRVLSDWGEGSSVAPGQQGAGGPAATGDATWLHTYYDTDFWGAPGGDYATGASATTSVSGFGPYTWNDVGMVTDVQAWVDDPSSNFGWVIIGNEAEPGTAKTFSTREASVGQPKLTVVYVSDDGGDGGSSVPAVSSWGAVVLALMLLTLGVAALRRGSSAGTR